MISQDMEKEIIQTGICFMSAITRAYGVDDGLKLWDSIVSVLDQDIRGKIFFALLTGDYAERITIPGLDSADLYVRSKIEVIRAIRNVSGLGLKEAKDLAELLFAGKSVQVALKSDIENHVARSELRHVGLGV